MIGLENFFIYWQGKHYVGSGRHFQQNHQPARPAGCISLGSWTGCVIVVLRFLYLTLVSNITFYWRTQAFVDKTKLFRDIKIYRKILIARNYVFKLSLTFSKDKRKWNHLAVSQIEVLKWISMKLPFIWLVYFCRLLGRL